MSVAIAVGLVIVASFGFAGGAILQHLAVKDGAQQASASGPTTQGLSLKALAALIRRPMWLAGMALLTLSAGMHIIALALAPVTVVQPIGILAVVWSVLLGARLYSYRTPLALWLAVAAVVAGITGFTLVAANHSDGARAWVHAPSMWLAIGVCAVITLMIVVAVRIVPRTYASLLLATAGAVLFGLGSALIKTMFVAWDDGGGVLSVGVATPVVLAGLCLLAGGWFVQHAYATGHPEIVVGTLTTVDPVVAVSYGLIVLDEGVGVAAITVAAMVGFGALAAVGVFALSRCHPQALRTPRDLTAQTAPIARPPQ